MLSVDLCCVNEERKGKTPVNVCSWRNISNMGDHILRSSDKKPPLPSYVREEEVPSTSYTSSSSTFRTGHQLRG
jgi:hypothetical protein